MGNNGAKPLRPGVGQNVGMDTPTRSLGRFRKGSNWSGNPGGRPKTYPELRLMCQDKTMKGVEAVDEILWDPAQPGSTRIAAWCALRDTGFDKPAQRIAFKDFTEHPAGDLPKNGADLDHFADIYKQMLEGAVIDVIPSPSPSRPRALSAPRDGDRIKGSFAPLIGSDDGSNESDDPGVAEVLRRLEAEEQAEQRASRPQPCERIRRRPRET
jgi:hypothetical protein